VLSIQKVSDAGGVEGNDGVAAVGGHGGSRSSKPTMLRMIFPLVWGYHRRGALPSMARSLVCRGRVRRSGVAG
jgi:hypothetical protein